MTKGNWILVVACVVLFAAHAYGQQEEFQKWSLSLSLGGTFVPQDQDVESATLYANHDRLHLEVRYNYEDRKTGSVWVGPNFSIGSKWVLDLTPIFGVIFGNTRGIAPGCELSLSRKWFEFYSETEYVFNTEHSINNFYYAWLEATASPVNWLRFGVAAERTKLYRTKLSVQRGLLIGVSFGSFEVTGYVMNLGWESPTEMATVGIHF